MSKDPKKLIGESRGFLKDGRSDPISDEFWGEVDDLMHLDRKFKMRGKAIISLCIIIFLLLILLSCALFFTRYDKSGDYVDAGASAESSSAEITLSETVGDSESTSAETELESSHETEGETSETLPNDKQDLYDFDYSAVPDGSFAIVPADLSLISYGELYIDNFTGYDPDLKKLMYAEIGERNEVEELSNSLKPRVLILHTHGTEAYVRDNELYYTESEREFARSHNSKENVIAVGSVLADILNRAGIPTVHSTVLHDSTQYKDSYARAAATVKKYLETYPSIELVIDVHRDSIINSNGDIIKPIILADDQKCAQVKCIVGSSWSGEKYDHWEKNLSLALKLRSALNQKYINLCRPVSLESTAYNQNIAPYSITLEIGSSGNSLREAMCAANAVGEILSELIKDTKIC